MFVKKISDDRDVYDLDVTEHEGVDDLVGEVWHVVFSNPETGDKSAREMIASQRTCTVTVASGYTGSDEVTVTDEDGASVKGSVTFGG